MLLDLLREAHECGVQLWVENGDLRMRGSRSALKQELRERIRAHKQGLLELLADIERAGLGSASHKIIPVRDTAGPAPLAYAQQQLWFLDRLDPAASSAYNVHLALRLAGPLDRTALRAALDRLSARHEILRTRFVAVDGIPMQVVVADPGFALHEQDLAGLDAARREADLQEINARTARVQFDLAAAPPVRGMLIALGAQENALLLTFHHIVTDAWSVRILMGEISALYAAFAAGRPDPLPALQRQYADYARWQRGRADERALRQQEDFWKQQLDGAPGQLALPCDRPRPARQTYKGAAVALDFPRQLAADLQPLSRRNGVTLFMTLLGAWSLLLSRYCGQDDVVVGTPTADRPAPELQPLIGFFVNMLAVRTRFTPELRVVDLLEQVKRTLLAAQSNQDLPFERVVELLQPARSLSHSPIFQTLFTLDHANASGDGAAQSLPGLRVNPLRTVQTTTHFDLMLGLSAHGDVISGSLKYASDLFDRGTIERLAESLLHLLHGMVRGDSARVAALPLYDAAERQRLIELGRGARESRWRDRCVHVAIAEAALHSPDACAVRDGAGRSLTYAHLQQRANRLANYFLEQGVGPGQRVGVVAERAAGNLIALLGVLASGAAYVPLDLRQGRARLAQIAADAGLNWIVSSAGCVEHLPVAGIDVVLIDDALDADWLADYADSQPPAPELSSPAYVIYTSGSTGTPKGVVVAHRSLADYCAFARGNYWRSDLAGSWVVTSPAFDLTLPGLYVPLLMGATVELLPATDELTALARAMRGDCAPRLLRMTPSHVQALLGLLESSMEAGHVFVIGGELFAPALAASLQERFPAATLYNHYGPTETTVGCAMHRYAVQCDAAATRLPIGRPMENTNLYVLEAEGRLAPMGVVGELYIGGDGVALGYCERQQLTSEKFIDDPFGATGRVYRSGDAVRWRADGALEFVGRLDDQVKLRGFRIELGDIEDRLRRVSGVADAAAALHAANGSERLLGYVVPSDGAADDPELLDRVRAGLRAALPDYMIPSALLVLPVLPRTRNGKVDRRALPAVDGEPREHIFEPPQDEHELMLARIWRQLLHTGELGRSDNFFDLGGHSLLAVQLAARLRRDFGVELSLNDVFAHPRLDAMARAVARSKGMQQPPLTPAGRDRPLPLSWAQQRLWFLHQLDPAASRAYHIPMMLRLKGAIDTTALAAAFGSLLARHESLRTCFAEVDDEPVQRILPAHTGLHLEVEDMGELPADGQAEKLRQIAAREAQAPFDLAAGLPIRARLIRLHAQEHLLLVTLHHIVGDGWSVDVLIRDLRRFYVAHRDGDRDPLPPLTVQYADYAVWQRRWLRDELLRERLCHWERALQGAPPLLTLPTDRPRPAVQGYRGGRVDVAVELQTSKQLQALARRHDASLFMVLHAAFAILLARLSGQSDVVIGSPVANRSRVELEDLIGLFVNTLPLRTILREDISVGALLEEVREKVLAAYAHQDVPFDQIVERLQPERSLSRSPIFQAMLVLHSEPSAERSNAQWESGAGTLRDAVDAASFDLTLSLRDTPQGIVGSLSYSSELFDRATIERWVGHLLCVLQQMAAQPDLPVGRMNLLDERQRRLIVEGFNAARADYPRDRVIHELFEAQVARSPDAIAVVYGQQQLSYRELNVRSNRLAHYLRGRGVAADRRVAICVERSLEMVIGILGVLKAGGAYVPLDPSYPRERLAYMLRDADPAAVLVHQATRAAAADLLAGGESPLIDLDAAGQWQDHSGDDLPKQSLGLNSRHLAYVIYTSGSTGQPKGVMVEHRGLCNLVQAHMDEFAMTSASRLLQFTAFGFDVCACEVAMTLASGACLCLAPREQLLAPDSFVRLVNDLRVTHMMLPPAMLGQFTDRRGEIETLQTVVMGGEVCPPAVAGHWSSRGQLINAYGPTEATVCATTYRCDPADPQSPPIGRPISNARIYILDAHGAPVPCGIAGEIYIGGVGVARGYLNRPELTAERFLEDPFAGEPQARMYRTGDLGRWRPGGDIEYLGRNDHQVKIRGHRIELEEIEAQLRRMPAIEEAVVIVREDTLGEKRLAAYYTCRQTVSPDVERLREQLSSTLPGYMVPAMFVPLRSLPLTPNGKVDRLALQRSEALAAPASSHEPARGNAETTLASIWAQLLSVDSVGRHDHFFHLGGHSLLAVKLARMVRKAFAVELPLSAIFRSPTLADMAAGILEGGGRSALLLPLKGQGEGKPLFLVHPVGGQIGCYRSLAESLPPGQAVVALQSPAAAGLAAQAGSLQSLAESYAAAIIELQPQGPYSLCGWSSGGAFALATAAELEQQGARIDFLGLLDSHLGRYEHMQRNDAAPLAFTALLAALRGGMNHAAAVSAQEALARSGLSPADLQNPAFARELGAVLPSLLGSVGVDEVAFFQAHLGATQRDIELLCGFVSPSLQTKPRALNAAAIAGATHYTMLQSPHVHEVAEWIVHARTA